MSDTSNITVQDCMREAFDCLLKGDTDGRDRWCALAERAFDGQETVPLLKPVFVSKGSLT